MLCHDHLKETHWHLHIPYHYTNTFPQKGSNTDPKVTKIMGILETTYSKDNVFEHAEVLHHAGASSTSSQKAEITNVSPEILIDNSIEDAATSWFVWLVAATASIAGMLFGYDTGIISAVLVYLGDSLDGRETSANEKQLITALCSGGAFIGSIIAGLTADKFGRKGAIYVGCILFTAGAIIQAAAYSIAQMAAGRLIVGFGVGSAAMVRTSAVTRYRFNTDICIGRSSLHCRGCPYQGPWAFDWTQQHVYHRGPSHFLRTWCRLCWCSSRLEIYGWPRWCAFDPFGLHASLLPRVAPPACMAWKIR